MSDFWRMANVIIVIVVIALLVWRQKRQKTTPVNHNSVKLDELADRKQQLSSELKAYEADINQLENEAREMLDEYFTDQEGAVKKLVQEEMHRALDEIESGVKTQLEDSFTAAKTKLQHNLDD